MIDLDDIFFNVRTCFYLFRIKENFRCLLSEIYFANQDKMKLALCTYFVLVYLSIYML